MSKKDELKPTTSLAPTIFNESTLFDELLIGLSDKEKLKHLDVFFSTHTISIEDNLLFYNALLQGQFISKQLNDHYRQHLLNDKVKLIQKRYQQSSIEDEILSLLADSEDHFNIIQSGIEWLSSNNIKRQTYARGESVVSETTNALNRNLLENLINKTNPILGILSILWYIPRFFTNWYFSAKYALNGSTSYAQQHAFEIANDTLWIPVNIITLGMSTGWYLGALAPMLGPGGIYLTTLIYAIDILNELAQSYSKIIKIDQVLQNIDLHIDYKKTQIVKLKAEINNIRENKKTPSHNEHCKQIVIKSQQLKKQQKRLTQLEETKNHIQNHRKYIKHKQNLNIIFAMGLFLGAVVSITNPIIGTSIILATSLAKYYADNDYLPKQEVRYCYKPLDLLHDRLLTHVEQQIDQLTKKQNNDTQLNAYEEIQQQLIIWQNSHLRNEIELLRILNQATRISQNKSTSYKALKQVLKPFDTNWESKCYKHKQLFITTIHQFLNAKENQNHSPGLLFNERLENSNSSIKSRIMNGLLSVIN
ncbi:hypothetical protein L3V86_06760 [Thiotrichales bacterium 19S11-10]|nr:hypothetical protein [Thiotrichales bacterium 19S11-10]